MPLDINNAKRLVGKVRDSLAKAVASDSWGYAEDKGFTEKVKACADCLGKKAWEMGFGEPEDAHTETETQDYGRLMGVGVFADADRKETIRQWAYQFVELAEKYHMENCALKRKLKEIQRLILDAEEEE